MIVEAWLPRAASIAPDRAAIEASGRKLSYLELLATAQFGAAELLGRGVRPGDEVAIALPPGLDFAIAMHSCWLAGATIVPVDLRLSEGERSTVTTRATLTLEEPLTRDVATRGIEADAGGSSHDLDAVAAIIHTSGTTSAPKRVEITFGNLLWSALGSAVALASGPEERWLSTLPVCHVGGLSILVRSAIAASTAVVHERFETQAVLAAIMDQEITLISVVATTLMRLLDAGLANPPRLRLALAGGGPVPEPLLQRAAAADVPVSQTYGLTETCSQASTVPLAALTGEGSPASLGAGRPLFCTQIEIADDGEILVKGPTVAKGAAGADGWLHTGDLGRLDEAGNLHVVGRKADTIISGGENVAPAEVEAALESHPSVAEAAVLARSDPEWGEAVTAIVVLRDGEQPPERELIEHCASRLAAFKVPKRISLSAEPLPRTRSGKLLRRELA